MCLYSENLDRFNPKFKSSKSFLFIVLEESFASESFCLVLEINVIIFIYKINFIVNYFQSNLNNIDLIESYHSYDILYVFHNLKLFISNVFKDVLTVCYIVFD
jgi:hypothetical protein